MHSPPARILLLLTFAVGAARIAYSAESDSAIGPARQTFLKDMKKRSPATRIDAISAFAKYPVPDMIETLLKKGLGDPDATVRTATRVAVRELGKDPDAARSLTEEFKRHVKKQSSEDILSGLLDGMVSTTDKKCQVEVLKTLDDYIASSKAHLLVPMTLIDELGKQGGVDSVESIKLMSKAKVFESTFGYRRCVVQAMSEIREREAIEFLVDMVGGSQGLVQADIIQYLTKTTKQKFKDNDRDWTTWWLENKSKFKFPLVPPSDEPVDLNQQTYYGIPICAKRIVFVLDTSASMRGAPMEAAKIALLKTVESLPESVSFDLVLFDRNADVWQPRLVPATLSVKQMAAQVVMARGLGGGTSSHAALNTAFGLETEAIYFLSDGEPTDGAPAQIVQAISERNRTRRISIHTIGVVTQRGGGAGLTYFMKPLAEHNYGSFRLVE